MIVITCNNYHYKLYKLYKLYNLYKLYKLYKLYNLYKLYKIIIINNKIWEVIIIEFITKDDNESLMESPYIGKSQHAKDKPIWPQALYNKPKRNKDRKRDSPDSLDDEVTLNPGSHSNTECW